MVYFLASSQLTLECIEDSGKELFAALGNGFQCDEACSLSSHTGLSLWIKRFLHRLSTKLFIIQTGQVDILNH